MNRKPLQRRLDLINNLPRGYQNKIARICNCSPGHVSAVLNGRSNQNTDVAINIIRMAEKYVVAKGDYILRRLNKRNDRCDDVYN